MKIDNELDNDLWRYYVVILEIMIYFYSFIYFM